jgi:hypothetical protein
MVCQQPTATDSLILGSFKNYNQTVYSFFCNSNSSNAICFDDSSAACLDEYACARTVTSELTGSDLIVSATSSASNKCIDPYQCNAILVWEDLSGESNTTYQSISTCSGVDNLCVDNSTLCVCNSNADCVGLGDNYCCGTYIGYSTDNI